MLHEVLLSTAGMGGNMPEDFENTESDSRSFRYTWFTRLAIWSLVIIVTINSAGFLVGSLAFLVIPSFLSTPTPTGWYLYVALFVALGILNLWGWIYCLRGFPKSFMVNSDGSISIITLLGQEHRVRFRIVRREIPWVFRLTGKILERQYVLLYVEPFEGDWKFQRLFVHRSLPDIEELVACLRMSGRSRGFSSSESPPAEEETLQVATRLRSEAWVLIGLGSLEQAEALLRMAIAEAEKTSAPQGDLLVRLLNDLAGLLRKSGRELDSTALAERARALSAQGR